MHDIYAPMGLTSAIGSASPADSSHRDNNGSLSIPNDITNQTTQFGYTGDGLCQDTARLSSSSSHVLESTFSSRYLGLTSETDPILRQRYQYDEAGYRISKLRGFRHLDLNADIPAVMLLTPLQVSKELADCVVSEPSSSIVQDLSAYGEILIGLFHRFVEPYYPVLKFSNLKADDKCKSLLAMVYIFGFFVGPTSRLRDLEHERRGKIQEKASLVVGSLFAIRSVQRLSENLHATLDTLQLLKARLLDWKTSFDHLTYLEAAEDPDDVFGLGSLLVAYQYCHVLIYRTALRVFKGDDQYESQYEEALQFVERMVADFSAMKRASFDSFWFSWSRAHFNAICDFVVLLRAISYTAASQERVEDLMSKYRHWLWMRSKSFEVVRMSLVRLDSIKADFCVS
ncbi:Hypothetical protein PENO1_076640 [Penicillium occitanis (nom. inval.)]|nr:Hypothetical protein PENO1_076640 [Penicillium occitanis (nom. inval.)]PCG94982.1 hypothetical protein PENOC_080030 [Penicillium occitanis (nom. inval.)]